MKQDDVITVVGAIGAALSIICIGIRFYARRMTKQGTGLDDWFILVSGVTLIAADILIIVCNTAYPQGAQAASNKDPAYVYTVQDIQYTKLSFFATVVYFSIVSATKASILIMYNRLFSISSAFRYQVYFLLFLTFAFWVGTTVSNLLNCIPMKYVWVNSLADSRYCFNYNLYWLGCGVAECTLDLFIILLPIRVVYSLKMSSGRKIAVGGVFLLGIFVIVSGVVKVKLSYIPNSRQPDFGPTSLWSAVHVCTGIICGCLPVCWPVFIKMKKTNISKLSAASSSIRNRWTGSSAWSGSRASQKGPFLQQRGDGEFHSRSGRDADNYELLSYNLDAARSASSVNRV